MRKGEERDKAESEKSGKRKWGVLGWGRGRQGARWQVRAGLAYRWRAALRVRFLNQTGSGWIKPNQTKNVRVFFGAGILQGGVEMGATGGGVVWGLGASRTGA